MRRFKRRTSCNWCSDIMCWWKGGRLYSEGESRIRAFLKYGLYWLISTSSSWWGSLFIASCILMCLDKIQLMGQSIWGQGNEQRLETWLLYSLEIDKQLFDVIEYSNGVWRKWSLAYLSKGRYFKVRYIMMSNSSYAYYWSNVKIKFM